jgi:RNA recognition motif-containing protein
MDRATGRSSGFGFVELKGAAEAAAAMLSLHDVSLDGRELVLRRVEERSACRR